MEAGWTQVSAAIEGTRLSAKAVVRKCTTPEEVEQIRKIVSLRKLDRQEREEQDQLLELYLAAIGEV